MIWKKKEHSLGYYIFSISHGLYYMNDEKLKNLGSPLIIFQTGTIPQLWFQ